jgi:hypothetical protein
MWASTKTNNMTPMMTMIACTIRRTRNPIIAAAP